VFKVGGAIKLQSALKIRKQSFVTIDGSTSPRPGISLERYGIFIWDSHDIFITHVRVRNSRADGITIKNGSRHITVDHCSLTNSADENIGVTNDSHDITVSWCIIGDTRPDFFDRAKGMLIANFNEPAVTHVFVRHNLFVNQSQRSPQVSTAGLFDIRNNVIWNWKAYGIRIRNGAWGNIVNNFFATNYNPQKAVFLVADGKRDAGPVYINGNRGPGTIVVGSLSTAAEAFPVAAVSTDPVENVQGNVLDGVGPAPRDAVDSFLVGLLSRAAGARRQTAPARQGTKPVTGSAATSRRQTP
jgi:pectate lyase